MSNRLPIGTIVTVSHQPNLDRGYVVESRQRRRLTDQLTGTIIAEHDSHGLCYEILFAGGRVVTFDREELEVVGALNIETGV
jgi:hypothetical protein